MPVSPAATMTETVALLRSGKITADEARARNRALKAQIGEAGMQAATVAWVCHDQRVNG
jgi:hypothetical protein